MPYSICPFYFRKLFAVFIKIIIVFSLLSRCFDAEGENVYLPYELKGGRFSALAKEENISGVHTIANLAKKRLPLMVRLAHGAPPLFGNSGGGGGAKSAAQQQQQFVPELRLLARSDEVSLQLIIIDRPTKQSLPLTVLP